MDYVDAAAERNVRTYEENTLITYDCTNGKFSYPHHGCGRTAADEEGRPLWRILREEGFCPEEVAEQFRCRISEMAQADTSQVYFTECELGRDGGARKWYRVGFVRPVPGNCISITFTDIETEISERQHFTRMKECDELTGLLNRGTFCSRVDAALSSDVKGAASGEYAVLYLDINRFKAINDIFGMAAGDCLLIHIADVIVKSVKTGDTVGRLGADQFVVFTRTSGKDLDILAQKILDMIQEYDLPFEITCNVGIYVVEGQRLETQLMIDRAVLAQSSIKDNYNIRYTYYTETLRRNMISEQEIEGIMATALAAGQFVVYYQPQYDHSTGMLVGSEALVRWNHPERGLISPGVFIPIFEKNAFIIRLDMYVFEQVCRFLRECMDKGLPLVPVSSNFSRHDVFLQDFVEKIEEIRSRYDVPARYLRVEITESVIVGNSQHVNDMVRKLHQYGYIVEMDDFGSGYSSLNVLKDIDLDIIKLDMLFLSEQPDNHRGGTILSSIVRMAKWLGMPVIAEGVETVSQADFLRSIGCNYIQGYLYSRPLPEMKYEEMLSNGNAGMRAPQMHLIDTMEVRKFWDPDSQETFIFNNYAGGAAIFDYHNGEVEILRVNEKYLQEICMDLTEKELIQSDPMAVLDEVSRNTYVNMLERAIETEQEQECETWRSLSSGCSGDRICIRSNVRMLGKSGDSCLFYAMIHNITKEKERCAEILDNEKRFRMASEQINFYCWEYTVTTREMCPCFRCMRDFGLPALMANYPDSAIEMGIIPPESADMYRDWHRQIDAGVRELETVIRLKEGRMPFCVRYTTEFDENGHPVKAYGSAVPMA